MFYFWSLKIMYLCGVLFSFYTYKNKSVIYTIGQRKCLYSKKLVVLAKLYSMYGSHALLRFLLLLDTFLRVFFAEQPKNILA